VSPTVYVRYTLVANDAFDLMVKTQDDPLGFVRSIREQIHRLDGDQMVSEMTTAEHAWTQKDGLASASSLPSLSASLSSDWLWGRLGPIALHRTWSLNGRMNLA